MASGKEVVLQVRNLTKNFEERKVLDNISFDVYQGEILVIMGGSGCGKSTLLRHLIGALKPDSGQVWLFGKNLTEVSQEEMDEIRKKIGMLFQSGALFDSMTVGENIALPLKEHTNLDVEVLNIITKMKLELVGLRGFEHFMPSQLSGGMKKRVGLARAIAMDPRIVFYDEPTSGLDPVMTGIIDKLTVDLTKALQITSVVVSHDMNSVFRIADRVIMLYQGSILQIGTPEEIKNSENAMVKQFVSGNVEGPISFVQDGEDYLKVLTSG